MPVHSSSTHSCAGGVRVALLVNDPLQRELMEQSLLLAGFHVHNFFSARELIAALRGEVFDLLLLERSRPDAGEADLLEFVPSDRCEPMVIFLSSQSTENEVVEAFERGAHDYLAAPFGPRELVARLRAHVRRHACRHCGSGGPPDLAPYALDRARKQVVVQGRRIDLTNREFELASYFFGNVERTVTRRWLLESVWGIRNVDVQTRTVDTHVCRIRKKLELDGQHGWQLTSIQQVGYRLQRVGLGLAVG